MLEIYIIVIFLLIGWLSSDGVKSQTVRLIDIIFIGPIIIYAGLYLIECSDILDLCNFTKLSLLAIGAATISYNGKNYIAEL